MRSIEWSDCVTMIANVVDDGVPLKGKLASSFYSHKEGWFTCTGDRGSRRFPPNRGGAVVEHCGKYTVGHGVGRGSRLGHRPRPCGDRASILTAPAGGVVIVVGCTVFQVWRGGIPWALQARVLHIYMCASGSGARGGPGPPLGGELARALRGSGSHVEVPDPSRGEVWASGC